MGSELKSVTVKMPADMVDQLKWIAEKRGETVSDTVRKLINRALAERVYEKNTELLTKVVRQQVEAAIKSYVIFPSLDNTERTVRLVDQVFDRRVSLSRENRDNNLLS
ncbi:Ribbon-helix-helix [Desulfitobacterium hafniense]|uniref:Ribbon-helix-helix n=1 Tax=Desulfitobacterium hafniense TaxID=49338 RepID=A0A098B757_DESHA|nr:hypothetical protein [Desulfitobacterium hafniense]CDX03691.1 Ribbon-helix-helix [Desulfitobacterium hafniense]